MATALTGPEITDDAAMVEPDLDLLELPLQLHKIPEHLILFELALLQPPPQPGNLQGAPGIIGVTLVVGASGPDTGVFLLVE